MYRISRIKLKGFKSFKHAEMELPPGFVAIAGPNGSGKSNITDAIRFVFGETSLKALRAKRTAELINIDCSSAEVTMEIEGEKKIEIKRSIREDGSTKYELDGRHVTREQALEALRPYGLEAGAHNIIAQGQVQSFVERNPKERRQIIDAIAGIAEFEQKKKDALSELAKVETRISEAKVVVAERGAFLAELEKEKEAALEYAQAKKNLEQARATLVNAEYHKLDSYFNELLQKRSKLAQEIEKIKEELKILEEKRAKLDAERAAIAAKIGKSGEREKLMAAIADIRMQAGQLEARIEEKENERKRHIERIKEMEESYKRMKAAHGQMKEDAKQLEAQLEAAKKELEEAKKAAGIDAQEIAAANFGQLEAALASASSQKAASKASLEKLDEIIRQYKEEISRAEQEIAKLGGEEGKEDERILKLQNAIQMLNLELEKLFEQEKSLNRQLPALDQKLLAAKEKMAALRGSASPAAQNPAFLAVQAMKKEGMGGIWGAVSELISVEPEYRLAVEAAAGGRLNYIVVESLNTAEKIIERLKKEKAGRATFIPLDCISPSFKNEPAPPQALGKLIDFVRYEPRLEKAMRYVFEETLLVKDIAAARKIGIGSARMVSLGGELLERSGAISGGSLQTSLMARGMLEKAEREVEEIKEERDEQYALLHQIREEMAKKRKERAEAELKVQSIQAETGGIAARKARIKQLIEEKDRWGKQLESAIEEQKQLQKKLQEAIRLEGEIAAKLADAKAKDEAERQKKAKASLDAQERYRNLVEKHASCQNACQSKQHEIEMLKSQMIELEEQVKNAKKQDLMLQELISQLAREKEKALKQQKELEEQLKQASATVQKYYDQMQQLQKELDEIGKEEGSRKHALETATRSAHDIDIKKAGVETKLADLKAEWEKYKEVPLLDVQREEAEEIARKSEAKLASLGDVNQKAPEMYEQKKKELQEIEEKVNTLQSERAAVIKMMEEIEARKREVFMDTYNSVNSHFKRLFSMVYAGEGTLVLDDPSNPLESGLSIKVRGLNEKRDKYLESMSGGEKTLLGLMFIFALHMSKPSAFYILDEAEEALDKENARKMADFIKQMSKNAQFIVVTHSDAILAAADVVLGVTRNEKGSHIVGVSLAVGTHFVKKEAKAQKDLEGSIKISKANQEALGEASQTGLKNAAIEVNEASVAQKRKKENAKK